jgi:plasmid stabilization system protein ParE
MARVVVTESAAAELQALIRSHQLPEQTVTRVQRSLLPLEDFPELGAPLTGALAGRRFLLGPWRWMIIIYRFYPDRDLVAVLAFADGRSSNSPAANR